MTLNSECDVLIITNQQLIFCKAERSDSLIIFKRRKVFYIKERQFRIKFLKITFI